MKKFALLIVLFVLLFGVLITGCSSSGSGDDQEDENPVTPPVDPPTIPPEGTPNPVTGYDLNLATGSYWTFWWDWSDKATWMSSYDSGSDIDTGTGYLTITLGDETGIGEIIPWDIGAGVFDRDIRCVDCAGWDRRTFSHYNDYYFAKVPFILYNEAGVAYRGKDVVEWSRVSDCEFMQDFARPHGLHSGLSPFRPAWPFNISIQRSRDYPPFTHRECEILDIVNSHLHNYLRYLSRIEILSGESVTMPGSISPTVSPRDAFRHSFTLTDREMEVIEGLCDGLSNRALAANLFISERTVKAHIASIFRKTGTKTRTAIVALAYRALRR